MLEFKFIRNILKFLSYIFIYFNFSLSLYSSEINSLNFKTDENIELNSFIKNFILENPEIIIEAIEIYQKKQENLAVEKEKIIIKDNYSIIFEDVNSYVGGNKDGDVSLVEFIDYNCGYCKKNHDIIMQILETDGNIKFIIKELPILGKSSLIASKIATSIYLSDGSKTYEKFLNLLMDHNSQLNLEVIKSFAKKAGSNIQDFNKPLISEKINSVLLNNLKLAESLSINGTPTFIIGDKILRGFISFEQFQEIIEKIRKKH